MFAVSSVAYLRDVLCIRSFILTVLRCVLGCLLIVRCVVVVRCVAMPLRLLGSCPCLGAVGACVVVRLFVVLHCVPFPWPQCLVPAVRWKSGHHRIAAAL